LPGVLLEEGRGQEGRGTSASHDHGDAAEELPRLGRTGPRTALANDLSAGGLRLVGDEDLPNDTLLSVRFTLPNELVRGVQLEREIVETTARGKVKRKIMVPPEPFREMIVHGKIVIAFYSPRRRKFAHGVQFIDIDERTREEIQRFIHVWQIRLLRERRLLRGE